MSDDPPLIRPGVEIVQTFLNEATVIAAINRGDFTMCNFDSEAYYKKVNRWFDEQRAGRRRAKLRRKRRQRSKR